MDFELPEEYRRLQELVERFVQEELIPREPACLARELAGEPAELTGTDLLTVNEKCREFGLWGLDSPEAYGGLNLPAVAMVAVNEEVGRTAVPFNFPPDSPNLHMLLATANDEQRKRYVEPYARGENTSAIAISEPGAGSDPASMGTRAIKEGNHWILNGRKIWVSRAQEANFTILMAVTESGKSSAGISAFIIERETPGFEISRAIAMIGGHRTYEIRLDDCRLHESQLLGELGKGAWCVGKARRAMEILCDYVNQRETFGSPLAERQAIQWWVADTETEIHACHLMLQHAAWKQDRGEDIRTEASMIKVYGTELASKAIDTAMQACGAMGMTRESPLGLMAQQVRTMRIYEGPSEIHRMVVARRRLRQ
jgi:acyl-CoA dehydrogenase